MDVDNATIITQKHQLVQESRTKACYQCGRVALRPLDSSALKDIGIIYYALADEVFCCQLCLYIAAMDHVPVNRSDVKATVIRVLGVRPNFCYWCQKEINPLVSFYEPAYCVHFCSEQCRRLALGLPQ